MGPAVNGRVSGELLAGRDFVQLFRASGKTLQTISVVLATYQRPATGTLTISLHRLLAPYAPPVPASPMAALGARLIAKLRTRLCMYRPPLRLGAGLAAMTVDCANLIDNEPVDLPAGSLATAPGEYLALRIQARGTRRGAAPTVRLADDGTRIEGHEICFAGEVSKGVYGAQAAVTHGGPIAESSGPRMILYSPVSQCNLNCIHCISRESRATANRLPESIKTQLRGWCEAGQVEVISSDYSGDILWADSRFGGELDFIFSLNIPFHIDTNGVCLTKDVSGRLCKTRLASINISLDAASDATFKRVRKGAPALREVTENIAGLVRARAAAGADFALSMSFTLMRSTLAEWPDFLRMAARLGVTSVFARHLEAFTLDMEADSLWHDKSGFNEARLDAMALADALGIVLACPPPFRDLPQAGRRPCHVPWDSAVMLGNGDIAACCVPGMVMGNLHENTMEEIWNGPRYQSLRATVNSATPEPVCAACPMFRRTDNPDSYLIHSARARLRA